MHHKIGLMADDPPQPFTEKLREVAATLGIDRHQDLPELDARAAEKIWKGEVTYQHKATAIKLWKGLSRMAAGLSVGLEETKKKAAELLGKDDKEFTRLAKAQYDSIPKKTTEAGDSKATGTKKKAAKADAPKVESNLSSRREADVESDFYAQSRAGNYLKAVAIAIEAHDQHSDGATKAAEWAARAGSSYRILGQLFSSGKWYAQAQQHISEAQRRNPASPEAQYLAGQIEFGLIMVNDFQRYCRYAIALQRHDELLTVVSQFLANKMLPPELKTLAEQRKPHIVRQQAEVLRYMGRYNEALARIEAAQEQYQEWQFEALSYARLSRADSLRLLGRFEESGEVLDKVEHMAKGRRAFGLLCSIHWRRCEVLKASGNLKAAMLSFQSMAEIVSEYGADLRYAKLYLQLTSASLFIAQGDYAKAELTIDNAISGAHLGEDYLRLEYATTQLFLGEIHRRKGRHRDSLSCFSHALALFKRMPSNWGIARSLVGLRLAGEAGGGVSNHIFEGVDKAIIDRQMRGGDDLENSYIMGFP